MEEREIDLRKGRSVSLTKGINKLRVEVSWRNNLSSSTVDQDYDIDLIAVECKNLGNGKYRCLSPDYLVFYGSQEVNSNGELTDPTEAVVYGGDDRGDSGDSGSEEMTVYPKRIDSEVTDIFFFINIYEGNERRQTFNLIKDTEVKVFEDGKDVPKLVYHLDEEDEFRNGTIMNLGRLTKEDGSRNKFEFCAIGEGSNLKLFQTLSKFGLRFKENSI